MSKTYIELISECNRLNALMREKAIRITLMAFSKTQERTERVRKLENKFYTELAKPVRCNLILDELIEEIWELIPIPPDLFNQ